MPDETDTGLRPDVVVRAHGRGEVHAHPPGDLDQLCINTIRALAMDAVEQANSGHPGTPMGLAPLAYVLSRQKLPVLRAGGAMERGAYVLEDGRDVVLIGTGSEVSVCLAAREVLAGRGVTARVVSMPSWELFRAQPQDYRDEVLPPGVPRLAVEAASPLGWCQWADATVTLDRFGASAPGEVLFEQFGFTAELVAARVGELVALEREGA